MMSDGKRHGFRGGEGGSRYGGYRLQQAEPWGLGGGVFYPGLLSREEREKIIGGQGGAFINEPPYPSGARGGGGGGGLLRRDVPQKGELKRGETARRSSCQNNLYCENGGEKGFYEGISLYHAPVFIVC